MADISSASELFLRGIEQIATALRNVGSQNAEPHVSDLAEAIRHTQAEHEAQRRRINEAIRFRSI